MLRVSLVLAVDIGKTDRAALDLPLIHDILHEKFGEKLAGRVARALAVLGDGHREVIVLADTAVLVPGIHGVHLGGRAVDISISAYGDSLL